MNHVVALEALHPNQTREDLVHSSGLHGYIEVMQRFGADPLPLLEKYHIHPEKLADHNAWIPHTAMIQLLEESAQYTQRFDLGLSIAREQDIGILGILGSILQSASTLKEAIQYSSNLLYLHGSGVRLYINEQPEANHLNTHQDLVEIIFDIQLQHPQPITSKRQSMDLGLGVCHRVLRYLSAERYQPIKVTLPHCPLCPISIYKRFFQSEVYTNQQHAALFLPREMLDITVESINHGLRDLVESYLNSSFRSQHGSLSSRVRHAIGIHLSSPKANKTYIAGLLAMHPRSLQRKLSDEGTSFEIIKDQLRQQLLLQYLTDSQISISQIAAGLGFSEQSSLSRACKSWFGHSPCQLRLIQRSKPHKL